MLKRVFRSIIDIPFESSGRSSIDREELLENFRAFQRSHIKCEQDSFKQVYYRILDHFRRNVELPCWSLLYDHFDKEPGSESVMVMLEELKGEKPYIGGNYKEVLREVKKTQDLDALQEALTEANEIAVKGKKVGKLQMKGPEDALDYLASQSKNIRSASQDFKTEADIRDSREIQGAKDRYEHRAQNQLDTLGIYTGLHQIDNVLQGIKHTELVIVGAYTAQGKTTFSLNILYRALYSGWDSALFTLEMSLEEMQDMVYVLHTSNSERWNGTAYEKYIGQVEYNAVREGKLSPELKEFYFAAMDDLDTNDDYGRLYVVQPDKSTFTVDDVNVKCLEINSELKSKGRKLEFIVIDYLRLMGVEKSARSAGEREDLNSIIKGIKRLLLTFNNGQGLRGLTPHQIKREGYVRALSNEGLYLLSDLSDTSEIEKSADVVVTLFMNDAMRKAGVFKICCLKARRNMLFDPFEACGNLASKYIFSRADVKASDFILDSSATLELST